MRFSVVLTSLTLLASVCSVARADIVTSLVGTPVQVTGGYAYTYNVELSGGKLDATNGTPTPAPQFGTIYDFGAATLASATGYLATNFMFSYDYLSTPTAFLTIPPDSATVQNVRFTYNGTGNIAASDLGTFTLISPYAAFEDGGYYDGQSYKVSNNTLQGNVGLLSIPQVGTGVTPEPSSLILLGTGLLGIAGAMRRRFV